MTKTYIDLPQEGNFWRERKKGRTKERKRLTKRMTQKV